MASGELFGARLGDAELTERLLEPVWTPSRRGFRLLLLLTAAGTFALAWFIGVTLLVGIGAWGNQIPVA
jgi:molybdopterin-containing oxidoreductase family membrane subunit